MGILSLLREMGGVVSDEMGGHKFRTEGLDPNKVTISGVPYVERFREGRVDGWVVKTPRGVFVESLRGHIETCAYVWPDGKCRSTVNDVDRGDVRGIFPTEDAANAMLRKCMHRFQIKPMSVMS